MAIDLRPFFFYMPADLNNETRKIEMDSKVIGERLRQIRKHMGITQKELAESTALSQSAISRLEKGEEIYASVLHHVLLFYHEKVSLDYLFSNEFDINDSRLFIHNAEEIRQIQSEQIQHISESLQLSTASAIKQLEFLKHTL